jgi:hypothetical protein
MAEIVLLLLYIAGLMVAMMAGLLVVSAFMWIGDRISRAMPRRSTRVRRQ